MKRYTLIIILTVMFGWRTAGQEKADVDSFPRPIPNLLCTG